MPCANLVNSNAVNQALAQSLLSSHLQPRTCLGHGLLGFSALQRSLQTLVPKYMHLPRVKTWRNSLSPENLGRNQESPHFCILHQECGLKIRVHISIPSYLHLSPNKHESRQCQLPCLLPNNLMLCRLARISSAQCHIRLSLWRTA